MTSRSRRSTCVALAAATLALPSPFLPPAAAQTPSTIKLVVPYPPGGSVDTLARLIQPPLQEQLKATVIVENRPGAGGRIAAGQVRREPADGSIVLVAPNALTTIQSLVYAGRLDYTMDDFTPVAKLASYPISLAVPASSPAHTPAELVALAKTKPASANYGTSGAGGMSHFAGLVFAKSAGFEWSHVAYKGGAPLITDLIGGHIPAGVDTLIDQIEHQRAGRIRVLGIFSRQRYPLAPEIPTLAEQGVRGMPPIEGWFGMFVPAKTPKEVVASLDQAIGNVLSDPQLKAKLNKLVIEVSYLPSSQFSRLQSAELQQWAPVVRDSGFKPE